MLVYIQVSQTKTLFYQTVNPLVRFRPWAPFPDESSELSVTSLDQAAIIPLDRISV